MKFKAGEIAILHTLRQSATRYVETPIEVEITDVGPFVGGHRFPDNKIQSEGGADYRVMTPCGIRGSVLEWQLRKRPQPNIPEAILRIFEVKAKQERPA